MVVNSDKKRARREGFADGKEDGLKTGELRGMIRIYIQEMHLPVEEVAKKLSVDTETVEKILAEMK
jgi:predicted transposase YdaD